MYEGKILKALSGFYYVERDGEMVQCRGRGVFRKNKITPLVGDNVLFQVEVSGEGYIMEVQERKNELVRPPIANVDQAILVFSAIEPDFSSVLLDRFLALVEFNRIEPIIVISKMDLLNEEQIKTIEQFAKSYQKIGYEVLLSSSTADEGAHILLPYLKDKISVFAGQSGVGKSTLLNVLNPDLQLKTADISTHLGRGKHTTRHVELMSINDGLVADTPGFSSLEFIDMEISDLNYCFPEIDSYSKNCKFRGCTHMKEPKCAVKEAVDAGEIETYRYEHYTSFVEEIKDRKPRY